MGQINQPAGSGHEAANLLRVVLTPTIIFAAAAVAVAQRIPPTPSASNFSRFSVQASPAQTAATQSAPSPTPAPQNRLTRDEAVRLALAQASAFQTARYSEQIAEEDVKQARAAFLPRITAPSTVTYNSPTLGPVAPGTPRSDRFSFIAANAVIEYESLVGAGGEIDIAGRLRAALRRSVALLEAARAGTEIARRTLLQAVDEAYYGLALAITKRRSAELSLRAAEEFARVTDLMFNAGEVAQVDSTRARVQVASRRDELEQARVNEAVAAGGLRVLIGYDFSAPLEINDLTSELPNTTELDRFVASAISNRPEFAQFEAQRRAAEQDRKAARAERLPQVTYSINGGFDSQSLKPDPIYDHTGILATVSVTVPIFDWGASRSRERQARLRAQSLESERTLALRNFNQQFYAARSQAVAAAERYQFLSVSVADAERNVQASIARYRSGEAQLIEVTDALGTLASQRAALSQALFDYQTAKARLAQVTAQ